MKKLTLISLILMILCPAVFATAASAMEIRVNDTPIVLESPAVVQDGRTLVPIRPIANAMGLTLVWIGEEQTTSLWNENMMVRLQINSNLMDVNGNKIQIDTPPTILYDRTYMPVRAIVEAFGAAVHWTEGSLQIQYPAPPVQETPVAASAEAIPAEPAVGRDGKYFFSQPQSDWGFANNGRGYCWVCSYAMLISNVKGQAVTPVDVAAFNMEEGGNGAYMRSHTGIVERFGVRFVPALDENSPYFAKYESWRGGTYLNVTSDADVVNALKEALNRNPQGVIVRYNGYPHSMVAVGYVGDTIYFNEPAYVDGEWIPFEETCLKNYKLADITLIQAIA